MRPNGGCKNESAAKNRSRGWLRENLINTDVTVCSHITPHIACRLIVLPVWLNQRLYIQLNRGFTGCGFCNVRVKLKSFCFDQRYLSVCVLMSLCL